ncbi:unnamed protein product [Prunus armeniaca]
MLLQKAIETPHRLPKPEELKGKQYCRWYNSWNHSTNSFVVFIDIIQEGIMVGRLKLAEKPPSITTYLFPQPQVNMANLNWPKQEKCKLIVEVSPNMGRKVTKEVNRRPKATISAGVVLCSKCKCENKSSSVPCLLGDLSNPFIIHIAFICMSVTHAVEGTKTVVAVFLR